MARKTFASIIFVLIFLGIVAQRELPKRSQGTLSGMQLAVVENALSAEPTTSLISEMYYPVTRVVDGDTIVVDMNGKKETVRLIGLDTPETVGPRKPASARQESASARRRPVQCFGIQASDEAKKLLTGKRVRIETDASQGERDRYGRLLAYVFMEDGTLFNQTMVEEGYGHEYTYNVPYKYQKQFKAAENAARENNRGLWAPETCPARASKTRSKVV